MANCRNKCYAPVDLCIYIHIIIVGVLIYKSHIKQVQLPFFVGIKNLKRALTRYADATDLQQQCSDMY